MEVLNGDEDRCHQQFRMENDFFTRLCEMLSNGQWIEERQRCVNRGTNGYICFFITLGHGSREKQYLDGLKQF